MNLEIDKQIFNWLVDLLILKPSPGFKHLNSGKIALDQKTTRGFETGMKFMSIIQNLQKVSERVTIFSFVFFIHLLGQEF